MFRLTSFLRYAGPATTLLALASLACSNIPGLASAPAATATTAPASATRPAATAAATTPAATTPAAQPSPASGAGVRLVIAADSSEARWKVREQLAGISAPNDAVGATKAVTGTLVLGANNAVVPAQSKIVVNVSTLKSDRDQRDNFIKQNTLQTNQFPTAELAITAIQGLTGTLPVTGTATVQILGNLTVRGVTKPTTWQTTATFSPQGITGKATTEVKLTDFGMTPPKVGPVLSIEDKAILEIDFRATRAPA